MDFSTLLSRYATLIVRHGLNVQPGQFVNLAAEAYHRDFVFLIAEEAYRSGASYVNIDLHEPRLQKLRVQYSTLEQMNFAPGYLTTKYRDIVDQRGANLRIVGPEDPDLLVGLDAKKINTARVAQYQAIKYFYEHGIEKSAVHWTLAAAATEGWARRLFPNMTAEEGKRRLWDEIFKIARVDHDDFLAQWEGHNTLLHERAKRLTDLKIKALRFRGPGTDLTVGLSDKAVFKAGSDTGPRGVDFEPNIPTEECFTTPDYRLTQGEVTTTRPFFINGTLVKGLRLRFDQGCIVEYHAEQGLDTFREYISSDEGGRRLGEVALVGIDSPIYRSGLVFEEILLDENAACHIAVGSSYKFCIQGGATMSREQLSAIGANESSVHTDMMISSEHVDVIATTASGSSVTLIERGEWKSF